MMTTEVKGNTAEVPARDTANEAEAPVGSVPRPLRMMQSRLGEGIPRAGRQ